MATFLVTITKMLKNAVFMSLFLTSMASVSVSAHQFQVGGDPGWVKPTASNLTETYNKWATTNRFHIGDTLYFKYQRDSVLVVNFTDYQSCRTLDPISKFDDGNTVFQFDRSGFFYFISGEPGHCKSGQKIIVRVMHPSEVESPVLAPSPAAGGGSDGGDGWGSDNGAPPGFSSTTKLSVVSSFMTFLGAAPVFLILVDVGIM